MRSMQGKKNLQLVSLETKIHTSNILGILMIINNKNSGTLLTASATSAASIPSTSKPVSALDSHLGFWLRYVSNHVSGRFEKSVEAAGVSISEWVALRILYSETESTPTDLMRELGMTKGAISKILASLEKKELLSREVSQLDRRAQKISLTKKAKNLVPKLATLADQNDELFFGHMSAQQRTDLISNMQKIIDLHGMRQIPVE